ncbi:dTDP-4-dehydrorhamnose reductase [Legionella fairfieldensis]|uniref:dTDP-4-dehydrorhamnose reductase n=1 Tax=Legionella fairfieldensis TaxID=45064 RepID=UPI00048ABF28|nr:dTDP-4-dehydrorhamnose reductase [Legionella fairfieldensis]
MKILLFGKNGQLGWELQRALAPLGEVTALIREDSFPLCGDLSRLNEVAHTIRTVKPHIIVNAAAYTAVDKAEAESERASVELINAKAPGLLAREAAAIGAWLVHYSTDYVFDGKGSDCWKENDPVAPLNHYGKTKAAGEQAVVLSGCNYLIFRTSWIYSNRGNNFVKTIIRLAYEQTTINVVNDQIGAPTGADFLADITAHALCIALQNPTVKGLYHIAAQGETSWYDYANFIIKEARNLGERFQVKTINPVDSADYFTPAKRPLNSRLNTTKFSDVFPLHLPHWEFGVNRMLKEFLG